MFKNQIKTIVKSLWQIKGVSFDEIKIFNMAVTTFCRFQSGLTDVDSRYNVTLLRQVSGIMAETGTENQNATFVNLQLGESCFEFGVNLTEIPIGEGLF